MKDFGKKLMALTLGIFVSLVLLELILKLFNPFQLSVKGDSIILETNIEWRYKGSTGSKVDEQIIHRKNNIGFRGEDYDDSRDVLRVFAVGGSTTECIFLTEGKTWPDQLKDRLKLSFPNIWLNNAGFDGHSTFGHRILLKDHLARYNPDLLISLVGINEIGLNKFRVPEKRMLYRLGGRSDLVNLAVNLYRSFKALRRGIWHNTEGLQESWLITWEIEDETIEAIVSNAKKYEDHYKTRLKELVQITRDLGAEIVLVTQPVLYGKGIDDQTGLDLSRIYVEGVDGATAWHILEAYNDVTRSVSREYNVHLIDLARLMPKSSLYFYDTIHFTNEGAERVSEILYESLCSYMADRFPSEVINKCQSA